MEWRRLLPALLLTLALVTSGAAVPDLQPVKAKQGAGFFTPSAADATSSGFFKSAPVLHVTERFTLAAPVAAPFYFFVPLVAFGSLWATASIRTRAPPSIPAPC